ncbi:MAG TPA: hypothetical protein VK607_10640 [Kofleriaceae bacterium]|nr:hypothetical protein [Kofleriaceae bacterium]
MASKTKSGNGQSSKRRQGYLAGTAPPEYVDEIDDAIANYVAAMYKVRELSQALPGLKAAVQAAMQSHKRKSYTYSDAGFEFACTVDTETELHVKRTRVAKVAKGADEPEAEAEAEG